MILRPGSLAVVASGILSGTIPVFATMLSRSGVSAVVQVFWRVSLAAPILLLFAFVVWKRGVNRASKVHARVATGFIGIGAILIALLLTYIGSISLGTPVATAVLLLYSQPLFTVLLSWLVLGEQITRTKLIALILGISGVLVVLNPLTLESGIGVGQALALCSGLMYAFYIIASKRVAGFKPLSKTALTFGGALLLLVPIYMITGIVHPSFGISADIYAVNATQTDLLLGLVVVGTILPYLTLNLGLEFMSASDSGITLLVEPITASALGSLLLGQALGLNQLVGGGLIVASIVETNRVASSGQRSFD